MTRDEFVEHLNTLSDLSSECTEIIEFFVDMANGTEVERKRSGFWRFATDAFALLCDMEQTRKMIKRELSRKERSTN